MTNSFLWFWTNVYLDLSVKNTILGNADTMAEEWKPVCFIAAVTLCCIHVHNHLLRMLGMPIFIAFSDKMQVRAAHESSGIKRSNLEHIDTVTKYLLKRDRYSDTHSSFLCSLSACALWSWGKG